MFFSCAQIVSPTGGSRDTKGPEVLKYEPSNNTSNFKENKIKIYFNEFINLKDVQSQLIISPPLKEIPELSAKGKTLIIPISDTLKENTTYSFQFGNCVTDITEGNVGTNLKFVFSTGPFIDSFSVVGKILNSETFEPEKDFLVMIYDSIKFYKDSFSFKFLPDYFTKTDASGSFNISNVKKGSFKLFALKDANSNYKYDSPDEKIAFYDSIFTADTFPKLFELNSFLATPSAQFIKKSNFTEFQKMDFVFNKPVEKIDFNFFNSPVSKESYSLEFGKKRDSLTLYFNKKIELDSLNFSINENGTVLDTFYTKTISYDKVSR
ncbi:MAG: Ig-like domain-containing domain, partial [Bacteroidota bacterium]